MSANVVIRIVCLAAIVVELASMPLRKKKVEQRAGECLLPLARTKSAVFVGVVCFAPLMIVLQWLRDMGLLIDVVLSLTAVLGVEVVVRERILTARSGVYENALIVDGRYIAKESLMAVPELDYEDDDEADEDDADAEVDVSPAAQKLEHDKEDLYRRSVKVVTKEAGELYVGFADEDEKKAALDIIKDWV